MVRVVAASFATVALLGACTAPDSSSTASAPWDEKVYCISSNVPVSEPSVDGVKTVDPTSMPAIRGGGKGG